MADPCRKADFQESLPNGKVRCLLCPRKCEIVPDRVGFCGVRKNLDGVLYALTYGHPIAVQVDPIEKKPLKLFLPGSHTYSVGTRGCNLDCLFCQNYHLSRETYPESLGEVIEPERIVQEAILRGCESIAFTYNEPAVFFEYAVAISRLAHESGLKTVLVSNGFISPEAAEVLYPQIDAANFDMKGFSEEFYRTMCGAASLAPVLEAFRIFKRCGGHAEYTNLLIPDKNDSPEMIDGCLNWMKENIGLDAPLHFTAYYPTYRCKISPTPAITILAAAERARIYGFRHVFTGNI